MNLATCLCELSTYVSSVILEPAWWTIFLSLAKHSNLSVFPSWAQKKELCPKDKPILKVSPWNPRPAIGNQYEAPHSLPQDQTTIFISTIVYWTAKGKWQGISSLLKLPIPYIQAFCARQLKRISVLSQDHQKFLLSRDNRCNKPFFFQPCKSGSISDVKKGMVRQHMYCSLLFFPTSYSDSILAWLRLKKWYSGFFLPHRAPIRGEIGYISR